MNDPLEKSSKATAVKDPIHCASCNVRKMALFRPMSNKQLDWSEGHRSRQIELPARELIYAQDEVIDQAFTLYAGWVILFRTGNDGQRQILHVALPGDLIGAQSDWQAPMHHSALAITSVTLCTFPRGALHDLLNAETKLAMELGQIMARDLELGRYHMENIGRRSANERLAFLLLELFYRCHDRCASSNEVLELPLTQEEIGDALGLTNVHVSRKMSELEEQGMIERQGQSIFFLDLEGMAKFAQFDRGLIETKPML